METYNNSPYVPSWWSDLKTNLYVLNDNRLVITYYYDEQNTWVSITVRTLESVTIDKVKDFEKHWYNTKYKTGEAFK